MIPKNIDLIEVERTEQLLWELVRDWLMETKLASMCKFSVECTVKSDPRLSVVISK